jgi:Cu+-exporting ATPase
VDRDAHSHGSHDGPNHDRRSHDRRSPAEAGSAIDPVCGMSVDPHTTPHRHTHQGHPYYFCSAGCRSRVRGRSGALSLA